jgi:hypothetical protein
MGRIERGLRLVGISWQVLREEPELMLLPLMSGIALLAALVPVAAVWIAVGGHLSTHASTTDYVFLFVYYVVAYSVGVFFNAAMISAATEKLNGGSPSLGSALSGAAAKAPALLAWAVVAATVGTALRVAEERTGIIGRIVFTIIGVAWSVVTFFVVPVILFEHLGAFAAVKRSAQLFKQRWGEQFVGNVSMGAFFAVLTLALVMITTGVFFIAGPIIGIFYGLAWLIALIAVSSALQGVFNAALYHYAVSGAGIGGFVGEDLAGAFKPRRKRFGI